MGWIYARGRLVLDLMIPSLENFDLLKALLVNLPNIFLGRRSSLLSCISKMSSCLGKHFSTFQGFFFLSRHLWQDGKDQKLKWNVQKHERHISYIVSLQEEISTPPHLCSVAIDTVKSLFCSFVKIIRNNLHSGDMTFNFMCQDDKAGTQWFGQIAV